VRQQADARQALRTSMQARMQDPAAAAKIDHTAQRETMQKLREVNQAERDKAREALYAVLSPEQKQLADQRLGGNTGHRKGGHRHAS
jgi:Spy/CpxP family protein refolding chaperone